MSEDNNLEGYPRTHQLCDYPDDGLNVAKVFNKLKIMTEQTYNKERESTGETKNNSQK